MDNNVIITESDRSVNYEEYYVKTEYDDDVRKDRSRSCYVCETSLIEFFFNCGNGLCLDCVREHIKAQLDKYKIKVFSKSVKFVCAGSCKCPAESNKMITLMDKETINIFEEVLLKMYLNQTNDIISCPYSNCTNYGFVKQPCTCHECNTCGHKWTSEENIDINQFSFNNIKSSLKKYIISKNCNNCKTPIEKAEGCVHMECNRCDYSFCWRCTENWIGHSEYVCMGLFANEWEESFRPDFSVFLFMLLIVLFTLKLIFTFTVTFVLFYHIFKIAIFIGLLIINSILLRFVAKLYKRFRSRYMLIYLFPLILLESILYWYKIHPYSDNLYFYLQISTTITSLIIPLR